MIMRMSLSALTDIWVEPGLKGKRKHNTLLGTPAGVAWKSQKNSTDEHWKGKRNRETNICLMTRWFYSPLRVPPHLCQQHPQNISGDVAVAEASHKNRLREYNNTTMHSPQGVSVACVCCLKYSETSSGSVTALFLEKKREKERNEAQPVAFWNTVTTVLGVAPFQPIHFLLDL